MAKKSAFSHLMVQTHPVAGVLVRFRARKILSQRIALAIRDELESLIGPERLIILDLSNVEAICSELLGVILGTQKQLKARAGCISLCGLSEEIAEVFRITHLDRKFEIFPDLESALGEDVSGT